MAGYEDSLVINNLGALFFAFLGFFALIVVHFIIFILSKLWQKITKLRDWVSKFLYFNGSIRFVMEGSMDLILFSLINIKWADWSGDF